MTQANGTYSILIVEDESDVRELMVLHLKREGHQPIAVEDGEKAIELCKSKKFDLYILDWMLPNVSGLDLCKQFFGKGAILMVTARANAADIVRGLEAGADDYITKPFEIAVFLARVRALLRRSTLPVNSPDNPVQLIEFQNLKVNIEKHEVTCCNEDVQLTPSEFKLLTSLLQNQNRVLSRDKLIELVQGAGIAVISRTIDTHMFGLRKKLGNCSELIETVRGIGYRINGL